jgi:hypothetical protein
MQESIPMWLAQSKLSRRGKTPANLLRELVCLSDWQPTDTSQQRRKVLSVHVLHRQKSSTFMFANIVNAAHIGVSDLKGAAHFATEAIKRSRVSHGSLHEELQSHGLPQFQIVGTIHLAHTASAN